MGWAREALGEDPTAFQFGQAVRLLERLHRNRESPGRFVDPGREVVRFSAHPTLAFPASEIHGLKLPEDGAGPARMTVNFFGLVGPSGVLPHEYTLLVVQRLRARDGAMAAFLDIFNHRAVSLLYRAWRRHRLDVARERGEEDRLQRHLLDLAGEPGQGPSGGAGPIPPQLLSSFAGLLGPQRRSAAALEQLLEGVFRVPVEVQQFVGAWFPIERRDRTALGDESEQATLGVGAVAGDEGWDPQARVRVRLGPLDWETYESLLPSGSQHALLKDLTRYFAEDQFDFEAQLVLQRDQVPECRPGSPEAPQRLGWSTWIPSRAPEGDVDDTILLL